MSAVSRNTDLVEMARKLVDRAENKADYLVDTRALKATVNHQVPDKMFLDVPEQGAFGITSHTHGQIAAKHNIPKRYYDRIKDEHPDLWVNTVNTFFEREPQKRLVRTLYGNARAYLSDRYMRIDNDDIANIIFPVLMRYQDKGLTFKACEVTERKMYIQATFPHIVREVTHGDPWHPGVQISNSEIGVGSYEIMLYLWREVCSNGQTAKDYSFGRHHVGGRLEGEGDVTIYSDRTRKLDDAALMSATVDTLEHVLGGSGFDDMIRKIQKSTLDTIPDAEEMVQVVANNFQLNEGERKHVLYNMIEERNINRYGLANGITNAANAIEDMDRVAELQGIGGKIIDLTPSQWTDLSKQAELAKAA